MRARIIGFLAGLMVGFAASAQDYPTKLVRIIVASPPGGPVDITARVIAQRLSDTWGQSVIVENRVGASEMIGTAAAAKAPADGYTLLVVANPFTVNPAVFSKLPYDPERSFATVTMLTQTPMAIIANPKAPFGTIDELVATARARPGHMVWASAGMATMNHITGEQLAAEMALKMTHVPFAGSPGAANAVMAGEAQFGIVGLNSAIPFAKAGRLKLLAVTTEKRSTLAPELPTLAELGVAGIDAAVRVGMYAPAGTPRPVISKINADVNRILTEAATKEQLSKLGAEAYGTTTPEEHAAMIRRIAAQIAKVVQQANIKVE